MTRNNRTVAVLGAGPAGSIAARQLGRAGLDVLLIDPCHPVQGHGIESFPASGAPLAEEIGLLETLCANSSGPAAALSLHWRGEPERIAYQGDGPLILHRSAVHLALRNQALKTARLVTARVRAITSGRNGGSIRTDEGSLGVDFVVDARGRRGLRSASTDLIALPFVAKNGGVNGPDMFLEALPHGWLWATDLPNGDVHGALFQSAAQMAGRTAADRQAYARASLGGSAFGNLTDMNVGRPAAAGLSAAPSPIVADRHILIGDRALARDPVSSHGLIHAMRSAVQASVAVRTMLDSACDRFAAQEFLRIKHLEAVRATKQATARSYGDQDRYDTPFWAGHGDQPPESTPVPINAGPLQLAEPLGRAPILGPDRIQWAPAIEMPHTQAFSTGVGPVKATEIAAACRPPASLTQIAQRLGQTHPMPQVFEALEQLARGGAFVQARRSD